MRRYEPEENERVVVIEQQSSDIGALLLGFAIGAGVALLLAPTTGVETRKEIRRRLKSARQAAGDAAEGVAGRVTSTLAEAREDIERRIGEARTAVSRRTTQLSDAIEAGRSAARMADNELRAHLVDRQAARPRGLGPRRPIKTPRRPLASDSPSRAEGGVGKSAGRRGRPLGDRPEQAGDASDRTED
jgi:gas vesicle protein